MKWFLWIGGGLAGTAAIVAVLYFLGFGGVVRVVRAILDFLGDLAQSLRDWLRRPGNKLRGLCAVFGFMFLAAGLQSWQRGTVIVQQRADYTALKDRTDSEREALQADIGARDKTIKQFTDLAERQKLLLEQAARENAAAVAAAEAQRRRAAESEAKYQEAFNARPPECESALQVMAKACPTLKDY
jgi:predicted HicB family RNase H-like nuclease